MRTLGGVIRSIKGMASSEWAGCLPVNRRRLGGGSREAMAGASLELEEEACEGLLAKSGC